MLLWRILSGQVQNERITPIAVQGTFFKAGAVRLEKLDLPELGFLPALFTPLQLFAIYLSIGSDS